MSDEVKHSLIWACVVVVAVISVPWAMAYYHSTVRKAAIDAGLVEGTLPGASGTYWVERKEEPATPK